MSESMTAEHATTIAEWAESAIAMANKRTSSVNSGDGDTHPAWQIFRDLSALARSWIAQRQEIERLRGDVHECPKCGETCRECDCWRKEIVALKAEMDRLRAIAEMAQRFQP